MADCVLKQWILKYHPSVFTEEGDTSDPFVFAFTKSSKPLISTATFDCWHSCMGYPSEELIILLSGAATGIEILNLPAVQEAEKQANKRQLYELYELANPQHQILRHLCEHPPTCPFEHVWIDLVIYSKPAYNGTVTILHYFCTFSDIHIVE